VNPIVTGTATLVVGRNAGKDVTFKVFSSTPVSALQVFAKKIVLTDQPMTFSDNKGLVEDKFGAIYDAAVSSKDFHRFASAILGEYMWSTNDYSILDRLMRTDPGKAKSH
jgi:hypothetical protein